MRPPGLLAMLGNTFALPSCALRAYSYYCGCAGSVTGGVCSGGVADGVCSGTVTVGGVAVVSVGGVAGSDQTTSSAMTTAAAMMSNLFLSIGIPLFSCHKVTFCCFDAEARRAQRRASSSPSLVRLRALGRHQVQFRRARKATKADATAATIAPPAMIRATVARRFDLLASSVAACAA
jgi:hypothetical protein